MCLVTLEMLSKSESQVRVMRYFTMNVWSIYLYIIILQSINIINKKSIVAVIKMLVLYLISLLLSFMINFRVFNLLINKIFLQKQRLALLFIIYHFCVLQHVI
jgi:hypothetical protein